LPGILIAIFPAIAVKTVIRALLSYPTGAVNTFAGLIAPQISTAVGGNPAIFKTDPPLLNRCFQGLLVFISNLQSSCEELPAFATRRLAGNIAGETEQGTRSLFNDPCEGKYDQLIASVRFLVARTGKPADTVGDLAARAGKIVINVTNLKLNTTQSQLRVFQGHLHTVTV
jgi:hypothetical protein